MTRSPQSPVFSALEPSSSVDLCAQALRARILDGGFAVGARLPPERELAGQFNVNRVTVRSALGRLKAEGLVQVRQGRGYEVLNFERRSGPALLPSVLAMARERDTETLAAWVEDALAARRHLARAVLTEIAARKPDLSDVEAALDAFVTAAERSVDKAQRGGEVHAEAAGVEARRELADLDMSVVRALLDASQNRVLRLTFNPVLDALAALPELESQIYAQPQTNALGYTLLRSWLRDPRVDRIDTLIEALAERDRHNIAALRAGPQRARLDPAHPHAQGVTS